MLWCGCFPSIFDTHLNYAQEYKSNILRIYLMRKVALEPSWLHKNWIYRSHMNWSFLLLVCGSVVWGSFCLFVWVFCLFGGFLVCFWGFFSFSFVWIDVCFRLDPLNRTETCGVCFFLKLFLHMNSFYLSVEFSFLPLAFPLSSNKTSLQGERKLVFPVTEQIR